MFDGSNHFRRNRAFGARSGLQVNEPHAQVLTCQRVCGGEFRFVVRHWNGFANDSGSTTLAYDDVAKRYGLQTVLLYKRSSEYLRSHDEVWVDGIQ